MTDQMSFGGFAPPVPTDRLFFAIFPDETARAAIARLAQDIGKRHKLRGKPLLAERFHITLHHLGDFADLPPDLVEGSMQAASRMIAAPFDVAFDHVASFATRAEKKPCVLLGEEGDTLLRRLRKLLGECLIEAKQGKHVTRDFTPHVTLLYDRTLVPPQAIAPIAWTVREFALVHSLLGKTEHRILRRWQLRD